MQAQQAASTPDESGVVGATMQRVTPDGSAENVAGAARGQLEPSSGEKPHRRDHAMDEQARLRKAQRRRDQVRAASRRCRDRQRRETEELRYQVAELEAKNANQARAMEQLRDQVRVLEQERDELALRLRATESITAMATVRSPSPRSSLAVITPPSAGAEAPATAVVPDQSAIRLPRLSVLPVQSPIPPVHRVYWTNGEAVSIYDAVRDTHMHMRRVFTSTTPVEFERFNLRWQLQFWTDDTWFYGRVRKFFPGIRAKDVAENMYDVIDSERHRQVFTQIKERRLVKVFNKSIRVHYKAMQVPGRPFTESTNAEFIIADEPNGQWMIGERSIKLDKDDDRAVPDEQCNGYLFADTVDINVDTKRLEKGCVVWGLGRFRTNGLPAEQLIQDFYEPYISILVDWESLFVMDFMAHDAPILDIIS